jgi:hypothetical protein
LEKEKRISITDAVECFWSSTVGSVVGGKAKGRKNQGRNGDNSRLR